MMDGLDIFERCVREGWHRNWRKNGEEMGSGNHDNDVR